MLDVFFTVDVEIWCGGRDQVEARFARAFRQYVYGPTATGEYGLQYMLRELSAHGLRGVFFVEPLFAARCGFQPLEEIVGLIRESGHEVQLHMHTEWVDDLTRPLLRDVAGSGQLLRHFSLDDQIRLIGAGADFIERAGGGRINAFRAGNFACNGATLRALAANRIAFDSSYNACMFGPDSGILPGQALYEPVACDGVIEYPMTVFDDGSGALRHAQLTACSSREMEGLLWQAHASGRKAFVILAHNFELLNLARDRADPSVLKRFHDLCRLLDRNRDAFRVCGFENLLPVLGTHQPQPLSSPLWKTGFRMAEQILRRRYG